MAGIPSGYVERLMAPAWLLLCLLFGGSSGGGVVANALLQIAAGAIVATLVLRDIRSQVDRTGGWLLGILAAAAGLALLSMVSVPPAIWRLFAGRGEVAGAYTLIGMSVPWLPVTFTPDGTIAALLALLPPLAMFLLLHAVPPAGRFATLIALAAMAFVSVIFGVFQQVAGFDSDLYIYQYTSRGGAVGFFANRNHLATLCLMTMPFLAAFVALARGRRGDAEPGRWIPALSALLLLVVGVLAVQSRAGWILLLPTLIACVLLARGRKGGRMSRTLVAGLAIVAVFAVLAALYAPLSSADLNVTGEVNPQERRAIMGVTWDAIRHFFPIGTGWGSFTQIYPQFEPSATVSSTYINHAHNDYLEFILELGIGGVAILLAFVAWWVARIRAVWRPGGHPVARAATVAIGVVMAHSVVDYPARTAAIACVFALCCALTSLPIGFAETRRPGRARERSTGMIMLGARNAPRPRPRHDPVAS